MAALQLLDPEVAASPAARVPAGDVDVYLARVAHELRTPVSLISGSLENLQESLRTLLLYVEATSEILGANDEANRLRRDLRLDYRLENTPGLLRICSEGAQRLNHVVNQLRFHARSPAIDAGARTDVVDALRRAVAMALHDRELGVDVRWRVAADVGPAAGPAEFLGQVFLNVVRNAVDALAEVPAPQLDLVVRAVGGGDAPRRIEVDVRDNGHGIPEHCRTRIFDEFFSTKGGAAGLGLGLSISRDIVAAVGGTIELRHSGADGTAFRITLAAA